MSSHNQLNNDNNSSLSSKQQQRRGQQQQGFASVEVGQVGQTSSPSRDPPSLEGVTDQLSATMSKEARRKSLHSLIERRRRERMGECFGRLKELVPPHFFLAATAGSSTGGTAAAGAVMGNRFGAASNVDPSESSTRSPLTITREILTTSSTSVIPENLQKLQILEGTVRYLEYIASNLLPSISNEGQSAVPLTTPLVEVASTSSAAAILFPVSNMRPSDQSSLQSKQAASENSFDSPSKSKPKLSQPHTDIPQTFNSSSSVVTSAMRSRRRPPRPPNLQIVINSLSSPSVLPPPSSTSSFYINSSPAQIIDPLRALIPSPPITSLPPPPVTSSLSNTTPPTDDHNRKRGLGPDQEEEGLVGKRSRHEVSLLEVPQASNNDDTVTTSAEILVRTAPNQKMKISFLL